MGLVQFVSLTAVAGSLSIASLSTLPGATEVTRDVAERAQVHELTVALRGASLFKGYVPDPDAATGDIIHDLQLLGVLSAEFVPIGDYVLFRGEFVRRTTAEQMNRRAVNESLLGGRIQ